MIVMFKEYIGDGVYVEFIADTGQIRLWTERLEGTHEIFLENPELKYLERWIAKLKERLNSNDTKNI